MWNIILWGLFSLYFLDLLISVFLLMNVKVKMWEIENNEIQTHTNHKEHRDMIWEALSRENPIRRWGCSNLFCINGNDTNTKE